jgi:TonB family protein
VSKSQTVVVYPLELRRTGTAGEALISVVVDVSGTVQDAQPVFSTHPQFEASALESVKKWKFFPGGKAGAQVNARIEIPFKWTIAPKGESKPAPPLDWF